MFVRRLIQPGFFRLIGLFLAFFTGLFPGFFPSLFPAGGATAWAAPEVTGSLGVEGRYFPADPADPAQQSGDASAFADVEFHQSTAGGNWDLTVAPFYRHDGADSERTHGDLREAFVRWINPRVELAVGLRRVFWGVTESQHLVDIINQTDAVENPDGEDKLGQPMVMATIPGASGTLDLFLLPYFRARTFPGPDGRPRTPLVVDADYALYEHPDRRRHPDSAVRYKRLMGPLEAALSYFHGTGREPLLLPSATCLALGCPPGVLVPYYQQINQAGLEAQVVAGDWLWKLEAIHRSGEIGGGWSAWTAGYEYTFPAVWGTYMDLGVLTELMGDSRGNNTLSTPFEGDAMLGARLAVNDLGSTELLAGLIADPDGEWGAFAEGSRRFGNHLRVELEARLFGGGTPLAPTPFYYLRRDDYLQLTLTHHF
ncbi:MAG: hypothetical protein OEW11_09905 [Nitrospirota bacterium]|nr:hypothetical protein [Nitrospirota bacterium]